MTAPRDTQFAQGIQDDRVPGLVEQMRPDRLKQCRWFGSKSREIEALSTYDYALLCERPTVADVIVQVRFTDQSTELYQVPLLVTDGHDAEPPADPLAVLRRGSSSVRAFDALADSRLGPLFFELLRDNRSITGRRGTFSFRATAPDLDPGDGQTARLLGAEQSNTSLVFRDRWIMKAFRRLELGRSRDFEVCYFLSNVARFPHTPSVAGVAEYVSDSGQAISLAFLQAFVPNQGDGWSYVLDRLVNRKGQPVTALLAEDLRELGRVTGEMHRALSSGTDAAFVQERVRAADLANWSADLRQQADLAFAAARASLQRAPAAASAAKRFLQHETPLRKTANRLSARMQPGSLVKIEIHGDYHLGQVLKTADSFLVIDFEGEPARPVAERWAKQSPLRDVAGMLRSLNYAANAAVRATSDDRRAERDAWAEAWERAASSAYLDGYRGAVRGTSLVPDDPAEFDALLRVFEATKGFYEVRYELDNRPDWVGIPLRGLERLLTSG